MERRKKSAVWNFFGLSKDDSSKAVCVICNAVVTRGGSLPSKYTTTNMRNHLEKRHPEELESVIGRNQNTLEENGISKLVAVPKPPEAVSPENKNYYLQHHFKHILLTRKVLEMIILDCQPFDMINGQGFRNLLHLLDPRYQIPDSSYFSTTELNAAYAEKQRDVQQFLTENTTQAKSVACTCDIWSKEADAPFQSLTVHILDHTFTRHSVVVDTFVVEEEMDAPIADTIKAALESWNIPYSKVITFVRDNSPNIVKAFNSENWPALGCMWNTLHFAIEGSLSQSDHVEDCLRKCCGIVEYLRSSPSAYYFLTKENEVAISEFDPFFEIYTRSNSPLEVVSRLVKQREALMDSLSETHSKYKLSDDDWATVDQLTELLEPIRELSRNLEASDASLGMVIPGLTLLEERLELQLEDEQEDVEVVRTNLKRKLKEHLQTLNTQKLYLTSTVLDPRFKMEGFPKNYTAAVAKKMIANELQKLPPLTSDNSEPPVKKEKKVDIKSLWARMSTSSDSTSLRDSELDVYLSLPRCSIDTNIFAWWNQHQPQLPYLSTLAREVLCVPPTTADCYRLLGPTSHGRCPTQCSCDPDIVKKVVFLKKNMSLPVTANRAEQSTSDYIKQALQEI